MERLNGYRMRILLIGVVAAIVLGGESAKADFTFGEPTNLGPTVNSAHREIQPCISTDGLSLYFGSNRPGTSGERDIWVSTRATILGYRRAIVRHRSNALGRWHRRCPRFNRTC